MCFICDMAKQEAALRSLKSKGMGMPNPITANAGNPEPKEKVSEGSANQRMYPKYFKSVVNDTHIDVYRVHQLFNLSNEMLCHASKKLLLAGERTGEKSLRKDVIEARDTLNRYLELNP